VFPLPCMLVCILFSANRTRDRGCSKHPVFPAPSSFQEGKRRSKPRAQRVARRPPHIQLPSPALCAIAHWGGRSSIPETPVIEPISRSVLDPPPSRGTTVVWRFSTSTSLRAQRSNPPLHLPRYGLPRFTRNDVEIAGATLFEPTLRMDPLARNDHQPLFAPATKTADLSARRSCACECNTLYVIESPEPVSTEVEN
jgi:hypothetical protein